MSTLDREVTRNEEAIQALEAMLSESHRALARERERVSVLEQKRSDRSREARLLRDEVRSLDTAIGHLNDRLIEAQRRAKRDDSPAKGDGDAPADPAVELEQRASRIAALEQRVRELTDELQESNTSRRQREQHIERLERNIADFAKHAQEQDQRIADLLQAIRSAKRAAATQAGRVRELRERLERTSADDLKRIRGIGPAIETRLHAAGIRRFEQLADFVAAVRADHPELAGLARRAERQDWAGEAARLARSRE